MFLKSIITASILVFTLLSASCSATELNPAMDLDSCITAAQLEASQSPDTYELDAEEARTFCESYIE